MLLQAAKLLEENTQYLSDIDSRFGDGDHGITMGKIAKLIQERVPQWGEDSIKDFLDSLGMGNHGGQGRLCRTAVRHHDWWTGRQSGR